MKKAIVILPLSLLFIALFSWQSCKQSNDPDPTGDEWTGEVQQSYEHIEDLLEQSGDVFENYLLTMDTAEAKEALADWFRTDPEVEKVTVSEQGVNVEYKIGIWGGVMIDPLRDMSADRVAASCIPDSKQEVGINSPLKAIPNYKKAFMYSPAYDEFATYSDAIYNQHTSELPKAGMELGTAGWVKNENASLESLKSLSGYGYIHFDSHGLAFPKPDDIKEVYLMTGEKTNVTKTKAYWTEMKAKEIVILYYGVTHRVHYFVSPAYLTRHNDFSKDTVLFYGGFCFGYLGSWKNLVDKCAAGVYVAADWSVNAKFCGDWAEEMVEFLCNKNATSPNTVEKWYNSSTALPRFYTNAQGRKVTIKFNGRGDVAFWKKVTASIQPVNGSGEPISQPGKKNQPYSFKCPLTGASTKSVSFEWNFDDGSALTVVSQDSSVTHTWADDGSFQMKVDVKDLATNEVLARDTVSVTILPDVDILGILHGIKHVEIWMTSGNGNHYFDDGSICWDSDLYEGSTQLAGGIAWDGRNFSAAGSYFYNNKDVTISGMVTADGSVLEYLKVTRWYHAGQFYTNDSLIIEVANIPLKSVVPQYPLVDYQVLGATAQNHISRLFYMKEKEYNVYKYYSHSDWEDFRLTVNFITAR